MVKAGIIPEDVTEAVNVLVEKGYTITGLASVENASYTVQMQRNKKGKPPKKVYSEVY